MREAPPPSSDGRKLGGGAMVWFGLGVMRRHRRRKERRR